MKIKEFILITLGCVFLLAVLNGSGLLGKKYFGVWSANIDREIFESNKSHIHGTIQALNDLKLQYEITEGVHKKAFREAILNEYVVFKHKDKLPTVLHSFIRSLQ